MSAYLDQVQKTLANKSNKYWASRRTDLQLAIKSGIDRDKIDGIKSELRYILDTGVLNYPQTLGDLGIDSDMSLREKKIALGIEPREMRYTENELKFLENMKHKSNQVLKGNWSWRIAQESLDKHEKGWHPFFVTLTVDPKRTDPEKLWKEGREFRKYIRRIANIVCKELGHPPSHKPPYRPESDYVTYAGVIEHGKSREHHHGHFIIWVRAIPNNWRVCPNSGIRNPEARTHNECLPMRTLWPWSGFDPASGQSLSPALYFRSVGDIWEIKYNFVLPLKDGKPMKVSTCEVAGHYITKYLSKEFKEWQHRMKATRNLGMRKLKKALSKVSPEIVEALSWRPKTSKLNLSLIQIHSCPLGLLRQEAKSTHYLNQFKSRKLTIQQLLRPSSKSYQKMLRSVQNGERPERMDSSEFFDWVSKHLDDPKGYCETRLKLAHQFIGVVFPRNNTKIKPIKIGANEIGHT